MWASFNYDLTWFGCVKTVAIIIGPSLVAAIIAARRTGGRSAAVGLGTGAGLAVTVLVFLFCARRSDVGMMLSPLIGAVAAYAVARKIGF